MNPMLDIARRRYTAKHYDPAKPLSDEDLYDLLEIMRLAPSSVNIQPWHFYVLRSESAIRALAPAVKDFNVERIRNAGAIIIIALSSGGWRSSTSRKRSTGALMRRRSRAASIKC